MTELKCKAYHFELWPNLFCIVFISYRSMRFGNTWIKSDLLAVKKIGETNHLFSDFSTLTYGFHFNSVVTLTHIPSRLIGRSLSESHGVSTKLIAFLCNYQHSQHVTKIPWGSTCCDAGNPYSYIVQGEITWFQGQKWGVSFTCT